MASSVAQLAGLAVGGAAVAALGTRQALAVGAALHLTAAVAVRLGLPRIDPGSGPSGSVAKAGLRGTAALMSTRCPRRLLLAQWLPGAATAGVEALIVAYAGQRHFAPGTYALLMACVPAGMLTGALVVGRLVRPPVRERLVAPLAAVMGLPLLAFAAGPGAGLSAVLLLCAGTGFAYSLGLQRAFLDAVPAAAQGQAFGLLHSGTMTLQGVGPACFGVLATVAGTGAATLATACWIATWHTATPS
ncbi:MFS transporter [Kitasatospora sp. NPDC088351]|uniref:MFS transporter n=1 Tax=unclassified Kitasatospora TaxID=2633591 RepID=UPI00343CF793